MIFKGAILGGARKFHMDSYLNGTTVPFDIKMSQHLWVPDLHLDYSVVLCGKCFYMMIRSKALAFTLSSLMAGISPFSKTILINSSASDTSGYSHRAHLM